VQSQTSRTVNGVQSNREHCKTPTLSLSYVTTVLYRHVTWTLPWEFHVNREVYHLLVLTLVLRELSKLLSHSVTFAKQHNLKIVVKGTGHDPLGRSTARGGFLIWMHHLKQTVYNLNSVLEGAPATTENKVNAVTLGAGVQWGEAFDFVEQYGRILVGSSPSVGAAGGWVLGGGHGPLSPSYGLGIDNALQFTVVLADGYHVTANAYLYPELFWALSGGGGGTYGVVTSVTYTTYQTVSLIRAIINVEFPTPDIAQDVITKYIRLHPVLSDAGWSANIAISKSSFSGALVAPATLGQLAVVISVHFSPTSRWLRVVGYKPLKHISTHSISSTCNLATLAKGERTGSGIELASYFLVAWQRLALQE